MELKPTGKKGWDPEGKKPEKPLASIGAGGDNPWEVINRGAQMSAPKGKRRNWSRGQLGATPPRDGPFQEPAAGVAALNPTSTRTERASNPWELLQGRKPGRGR